MRGLPPSLRNQNHTLLAADVSPAQPTPCSPEITAERVAKCLDCDKYSLGSCRLFGCCNKSVIVQAGWMLAQCPDIPPKWLRINPMKTLLVLFTLTLAMTGWGQTAITNINTATTTNYTQLAAALNLNYGVIAGKFNSQGSNILALQNSVNLVSSNINLILTSTNGGSGGGTTSGHRRAGGILLRSCGARWGGGYDGSPFHSFARSAGRFSI